MAKNKINIVFVLDKSGSMSSVQDATISGFNEYVNTLKNDKNEYDFSLILFDTEVEKVYDNIDLNKTEELTEKTYAPNGMTALYDASCQALNDIEKNLKKTTKTLFVVMTDGEENSSREYTEQQFKEKIKKLEGKNFTFVFLGANQDSWANAQKYGATIGNTANFVASSTGIRSAMKTMASNTTMYAGEANMSSEKFFSEEDKEDLSK